MQKAFQLSGPAHFTRSLEELIAATEKDKQRSKFVHFAPSNSGNAKHEIAWENEMQNHKQCLSQRQQHKIFDVSMHLSLEGTALISFKSSDPDK